VGHKLGILESILSISLAHGLERLYKSLDCSRKIRFLILHPAPFHIIALSYDGLWYSVVC
jgi:hypothetical protein